MTEYFRGDVYNNNYHHSFKGEMELSTAQTALSNWTSATQTVLKNRTSAAQTVLNNWICIGEMANHTYLNTSSPHLQNGSGATINNNDENLSALLALFAFNIILFIFGLFGNISGIIVLQRLPGKLQTFGLLVAALAVTDMVGLTYNLFHFLPSSAILNFDVRAATDTGCVVFMVVSLFAKTNSAYTTVLICIDRFLAVQYPLKFKSMVTRKVRIVSLSVCASISLFVGLVLSLNYSTTSNGICQLGYGPAKTLAQYGLVLLVFALFTVIPMVILLSLTPVIIFRLKQRQTIMAKLTNKEEGTRLVRTSIMLTCVVVAYIVLVGIPSAVFTLLRVWGGDGAVSTDVLPQCLITAVQINHVINICFYNISNKEFREDFLRLFGCSCNIGHRDVESGE